MRWSNTPPLPAFCAVVITAFLSCSGTETASEAFTVRDSAGVTIAHSRDPAWTDATAWRLADRPTAVIGDAPDSTDQLWQVRGMARLGDGRLVVLNAGTQQLRFYDSVGSHLYDRGRQGEGPADFVAPRRLIWTLGDTLMVLDRTQIKYFDSQGTFLGSRSIGFGVSDVLANGGLVRQQGDANSQPPGEGVLYRPGVNISLTLGDTDSVVPMTSIATIEQQSLNVGQFPMNYLPPFARNTLVTAGGRFPIVIIADNSTFEFQIFNDAAVLTHIIRRDWTPRPLQPEWVEAWKGVQRTESWTQSRLPELERAWAEMTMPGILPAYEWVAISSSGEFWVLEYIAPGEETITFSVFGSDGRFLGVVSVPSGLRRVWTDLPYIEQDVFMGVWIDELGIEQVRVYQIERPS